MRARLLLVGLLLGATACGGGADPAPAAVTGSLDRVETLLEAGRGAEARQALEDLVRRTLALREAGELDPEQADRIVAAAARLAQVLPSPTPSPTASPAPVREQDRRESRQDKGDEDDGKRDKKKGKGDD